MVETLGTGDYAAIAVYFVLVVCVGMWSTFRPNKDNAAGYFLAGKSMHWFPVGASIYASNVGAHMFIGLAGTAAAGGFACVIYEWHAVYLLIALGWLFLPVYTASGSFTMPEYLKKRFGGVRLRIFQSVLSVILYILTKISSEIFSGAIFLQQLLGWNMYACAGAILGVTAIYTIAGGLAAVIYTDTLQTVILIIGAATLFGISMADIGGWNEFMIKYGASASNLTLSDPQRFACGLPREDFRHIFRDPFTSDLPWTGTVFGLTTLGLWSWCTDQIIVQRCLSAKNMSHSKAACVFGGGLKLTNFILFIIPGMISRIFFPDEIGCAEPSQCMDVCGNEAGCSNIAYPLLVLRKLPQGIKGVMLAALLAALMSSLTSIFNSASSMFTMDIWRRFRPRAKQHELMLVGRFAVLVIIVLSILWIPIMQSSQGGQLWTYLQTISSCISPPWCWVFLLAVFWKRTTEEGAFWGLVISTAVGVVRMVLVFVYRAPACGSLEPDTRPSVVADVHFLHFAIIISGVSVISTVVISLLTSPRPPEKLHRVTWWTRHDNLDLDETDSEDDFGMDDDDDAEQIPRQQFELVPHGHPDTSEKRRVKRRGVKRRGVARKVYMWLCGVSDEPRKKLTKEEKKKIKEKMTSIREDPKVETALAAAAIAVSTICTFLLGFFS